MERLDRVLEAYQSLKRYKSFTHTCIGDYSENFWEVYSKSFRMRCAQWCSLKAKLILGATLRVDFERDKRHVSCRPYIESCYRISHQYTGTKNEFKNHG